MIVVVALKQVEEFVDEEGAVAVFGGREEELAAEGEAVELVGGGVEAIGPGLGGEGGNSDGVVEGLEGAGGVVKWGEARERQVQAWASSWAVSRREPEPQAGS